MNLQILLCILRNCLGCAPCHIFSLSVCMMIGEIYRTSIISRIRSGTMSGTGPSSSRDNADGVPRDRRNISGISWQLNRVRNSAHLQMDALRQATCSGSAVASSAPINFWCNYQSLAEMLKTSQAVVQANLTLADNSS
jgi:hypothetical protein